MSFAHLKYSKFISLAALPLILAACPGDPCTTDSDCDGSEVCIAGACANPGSSSSSSGGGSSSSSLGGGSSSSVSSTSGGSSSIPALPPSSSSAPASSSASSFSCISHYQCGSGYCCAFGNTCTLAPLNGQCGIGIPCLLAFGCPAGLTCRTFPNGSEYYCFDDSSNCDPPCAQGYICLNTSPGPANCVPNVED